MNISYEQGIDMTGTELLVADMAPEGTPFDAIANKARYMDSLEYAFDSSRGEKPYSPALPAEGAMRGDIPLSWIEKEIK